MMDRYNSNILDVEFGEWDGDTVPLYITPINKGYVTLSVCTAIKEYSVRDVAITTYNYNENVKIDIYIGVSETTEWLNTSDIYGIFGIYINDGSSYIPYIYIPTKDNETLRLDYPKKIIANQIYTQEGIRFKYDKKNNLILNLLDLREKGIID